MIISKHLLIAAPLVAGLALAPAAYAYPAGHNHWQAQRNGEWHGQRYGQFRGGRGEWRGDHWRYHNGNAAAAAILGGLAGLGVGAAIAGQTPYYAAPAYPPAYGYAPGYQYRPPGYQAGYAYPR